MKITIEATVAAPIAAVWRAWTTPEDIRRWNAASDDWHCPAAELDLRPGGQFSYRMEAREGSTGFDFAGTFTRVIPNEVIAYSLGDERSVTVEFAASAQDVTIRETFDAESFHTAEQQRQGWQAILDNFARHVEAREVVQADTLTTLFRHHRWANLRLLEQCAALTVKRLAREIHDTLAQDFTSIVLHLEAADAALPAEAEPMRTHVARAREAARAGLAEARRLVLALRPEPLEGASLPEALRRVAARWAEETGVPAQVAVTGEPVPLHPEAEVTLLRAAQEALANVRKHAQARQVSITLSYMGDQVALDVQDDGAGFDAAAPTEGFGLAAMRQRAEQLGGAVVIESALDHGTTVALTLPLHPV